MSIESIVVYHDSYGCETGCCGHSVVINDEPYGDTERLGFDFDHPYGTNSETFAKAFAKSQVEAHYPAEHIADLDWDKVIINWDRVRDE